jgi:L-ribulose-5-phosphate 3-epimerase
MKKGIIYWAFPAEDDGQPPNPVAVLQQAKALGYDCVELTVEAHGLISLDTTRAQAEEVRRAADAAEVELLTLASGLAWGVPPTHPDAKVRDQAVTNCTKMLEIAGWLGAKTLLHLPGMVSAVFATEFKPQPYEQVYGWAREAIQRLLPTAERLGVTIGVENVWNRFLQSPLEMRSFIDSFGSAFVGSYFDVGNVMLTGHPEDWIGVLGKRIAAVHFKDFRVAVGNLDGFVDLLSGDVNFRGVMQALRQIGYSGPITAEIVPGRLGAAEKAAAAMKLIEEM